MNAQFPSTNLLDTKQFLKFIKKRGFHISINELEYYDKVGLIRPIIRFTRQKTLNSSFSEYTYIDTGILALQYYFKIGLIDFPVDGDYQEWSNYIKETEDVYQYYHPYQIIQIANIPLGINYTIKSIQMDKVDNVEQFFKSVKESRNNSILSAKQRLVAKDIPLIGLLILLDEAYAPLVKTKLSFNPDLSISDHRKRWSDWTIKKFSPNKILLLSAINIEKIKEYYRDLAAHATTIDPLERWFVLQQIIKNSHRYVLKDKALLAQDYYAFLYMLGSYIFDLTGKKMFDPDDVFDSEEGRWKKQIFGDPFDYSSRITQNKILKYYMIDFLPELVIIVEGQTEKEVMKLILNEIEVDREKDGFFIHNIEGHDKLRHIKPLLHLSRIIELKIFVIIDNDNDWNKKLEQLRVHADKSREIIVRKWKGDFEYDNFGIELVIEKINGILIKNRLTPLKKNKIESEMKKTNEVLMTTIRNAIKKNDWIKIKKCVKKLMKLFPNLILANY